MTVTLDGRVYDVVLTYAGRPLVIVQRGPRMWREAPAQAAARVLAGFQRPVLRVVGGTGA